MARLGGGEFTVIITGAEQREDVELVAQKIEDALSTPFQVARRQVRIYVSIGHSFYPRDATSPVALLEAADRAMYRAKTAASDAM